MERCPKCGGTTGYYYRIIVTYEQWKEWDGEAISAEQTGSPCENKTGKTGGCLDCRYRFRLARLKNDNKPIQPIENQG